MLETLKGLGKHIFEDESKSTPAQPSNTNSPLGVSAAAVTSGVQTAASNNEYIGLLRQALKSRITAFTNLLTAADKLQNVIPDPSMRLKAAYEMVKAEGRGLTELLQAIEIHAADLASQERTFMNAAETALGTAINAMERELQSLEATNTSARQQIESFQQQIATLNTTIANNSGRQVELSNQIATERARFDSNKVQFNSALATVQAELASQKTIISSTLA
jgi:predicted  nucleic acid-binding Zn-ribbon protein